MKARARSLRRKSTDAEILLWQHLRNRRMQGCKFRRQVPIGKYNIDFLCEFPQSSSNSMAVNTWNKKATI